MSNETLGDLSEFLFHFELFLFQPKTTILFALLLNMYSCESAGKLNDMVTISDFRFGCFVFAFAFSLNLLYSLILGNLALEIDANAFVE